MCRLQEIHHHTKISKDIYIVNTHHKPSILPKPALLHTHNHYSCLHNSPAEKQKHSVTGERPKALHRIEQHQRANCRLTTRISPYGRIPDSIESILCRQQHNAADNKSLSRDTELFRHVFARIYTISMVSVFVTDSEQPKG